MIVQRYLIPRLYLAVKSKQGVTEILQQVRVRLEVFCGKIESTIAANGGNAPPFAGTYFASGLVA